MYVLWRIQSSVFPGACGGSLMHVRANSFMEPLSDDSWGSAPVVVGGGVCWTELKQVELLMLNCLDPWLRPLHIGRLTTMWFPSINESSRCTLPLGWVSLPSVQARFCPQETLSDPSCGQIHEILSGLLLSDCCVITLPVTGRRQGSLSLKSRQLWRCLLHPMMFLFLSGTQLVLWLSLFLRDGLLVLRVEWPLCVRAGLCS